MKLKKLENKLKNQFMNDAEELTAIMQDQFGDEKILMLSTTI